MRSASVPLLERLVALRGCHGTAKPPAARRGTVMARRGTVRCRSGGGSGAAAAAASAAKNAAAFDARHGHGRGRGAGAAAENAAAWNPPFRAPVEPHPVSPWRAVPPDLSIPAPPYAATGIVPSPPLFAHHRILLHDAASVARMRRAARLARNVLDLACDLARPGTTTDAIDARVHGALLAAGAYPSPLNYAGFPKSVCTSVGEVICHGIPDARPLRPGDVVSFDVSCFLGGVHGDNCATVVVGDTNDGGDGDGGIKEEGGGKVEGSPPRDWRGVPQRTEFGSAEEEETYLTGRRLVRAALEGLEEGVAACRPGGCLTEVGAAIHAVSDAYGYGTVRKYRGHGIGETFHCAPFVKHYRNSDRLELEPGMIFTIEPMLTEGSEECYEWDDEWTVATADGGRAAQFEHTVLITEDGVEVLTLPGPELG